MLNVKIDKLEDGIRIDIDFQGEVQSEGWFGYGTTRITVSDTSTVVQEDIAICGHIRETVNREIKNEKGSMIDHIEKEGLDSLNLRITQLERELIERGGK